MYVSMSVCLYVCMSVCRDACMYVHGFCCVFVLVLEFVCACVGRVGVGGALEDTTYL